MPIDESEYTQVNSADKQCTLNPRWFCMQVCVCVCVVYTLLYCLAIYSKFEEFLRNEMKCNSIVPPAGDLYVTYILYT